MSEHRCPTDGAPALARISSPVPSLSRRHHPLTANKKPPRQRRDGQSMTDQQIAHWGGWTRTNNIPINSRVVCQLTYAPSVPSQTPLNKKPATPSGGPRFHSTTTRQPDPRAELRLFGRLEFELRVVMVSNLTRRTGDRQPDPTANDARRLETVTRGPSRD